MLVCGLRGILQVNGYFELSANRRDLWSGKDADGEGRVRAQWNHLLLEDVIAPSYARLLRDSCKLLGPEHCRDFYRLWPGKAVNQPWDILVKALVGFVKDLEVLYSPVDGGKWVSPKSAVLIDDDSEEPAGGPGSSSSFGALALCCCHTSVCICWVWLHSRCGCCGNRSWDWCLPRVNENCVLCPPA
jgi:hypothetical protein